MESIAEEMTETRREHGMKSTRQDDIIRIISAREIETQEELAGELRSLGYQVTQATISRDIKELHLIKVIGEHGMYKYAKPERKESAVNERLVRILTDSLISVDHAGQIIVVRTLSGSANVACEAIDTMQWPEILGTIAGDNTIFIVVRNAGDADKIGARIRRLISGGL